MGREAWATHSIPRLRWPEERCTSAVWKIKDGIFVCFDAATGRRLWQWTATPRDLPRKVDGFTLGIGVIPQQIGVCSSSAVEGDRVYFVSNRFDVVCLDAAGSQAKAGDARVVWTYDMWDKAGRVPLRYRQRARR